MCTGNPVLGVLAHPLVFPLPLVPRCCGSGVGGRDFFAGVRLALGRFWRGIVWSKSKGKSPKSSAHTTTTTTHQYTAPTAAAAAAVLLIVLLC